MHTTDCGINRTGIAYMTKKKASHLFRNEGQNCGQYSLALLPVQDWFVQCEIFVLHCVLLRLRRFKT